VYQYDIVLIRCISTTSDSWRVELGQHQFDIILSINAMEPVMAAVECVDVLWRHYGDIFTDRFIANFLPSACARELEF